MSQGYLPYHRKYRPSSITQYIGNEKVKNSVMAMLRGNIKPQVLLFQGHAGCGKTTMARLVAVEYSCENRDEATGACGKCYNCLQLKEYIESGDSGGLMNLREIDIADSSRKQDIEEVLEEVMIPTFDGSWRIYILDEFHMASQAAQNRLLKIAEEPPEKVLIILCTTDPERILSTIISRCQYIFNVVKPSRKELVGLLSYVCKKEGIKNDARALSLVCVKGDFVPRKALITLEQVVREKVNVTYDNAVEVLNILEGELFFEFYNLLLDRPIDVTKYVTFIGKVKEKADLKLFVENLLQFTVRGVYVNHGMLVDALDRSEITQYKKLFMKFTPIELVYILDLLLNMRVSVDIEAKLMLLGYKGIGVGTGVGTGVGGVVGVVKDDLDMGYLVRTDNIGIKAEKVAGSNNHINNVTMTEEEKEVIIKEQTQVMSADDIVKMLEGVKVFK